MIERALTKRNLTVLMIAMLVALPLLTAVCIARYAGVQAGFELPFLLVGLLVLLAGMFAGAGVVWSSSRGPKDQTAFARATLPEKTVWLGGAVVALIYASVNVYFAFYTSASWPSAFEPLMIFALIIPSLAQISVGRRMARE